MQNHFIPGFLIGGCVFGLMGIAFTWLGPVQVRDNVIVDMEKMIEKYSRRVFDGSLPGCEITLPSGHSALNSERILLQSGTEISPECFK